MNGPISTDPLASEGKINLELSASRSQVRGLHAMSLDLCSDLLMLLAPLDQPVGHRQVVHVTRGFDSVERGLLEITEGTRSLPAATPQLALPAASF